MNEMSNYLTPSKVGLLVLISLYSDAVVPVAATVPVLSFVTTYLLLFGTTGPGNKTPGQFTIVIEDFQKATNIHASGIPGRTIWDLFLKRLWEINSLDALHVFFDSLSCLLPNLQEDALHNAFLEVPKPNRVQLSRTSPFGTFVRRTQLEFTHLLLQDATTLWRGIIAFRLPTSSAWQKRNPTTVAEIPHQMLMGGLHGMPSKKIIDMLYRGDQTERVKGTVVTPEDIEKMLEFQVDQMQRTGSRVSRDVKTHLELMIHTSAAMPNISHYVRFLDAWKSGDYPSSFDNLHRYFDYIMHNRDKTFYQYALLNLALLKAEFGCFSEAIAAMHETICTARENKDMACLNYSLSWLYHYSKAHPEEIIEVRKKGLIITDKEALAFLKSKAKEINMWSLLSTSLLSEAKLVLSRGEDISLAFESVTKASYLNVMKDVQNVVGSQTMMLSSMFSRLGLSYTAWSLNEVFLECYSKTSPAEDGLLFIWKSAIALGLKGRFKDGATILGGVNHETLQSLKCHENWTAYSALLKVRRALHKNDLLVAERFLFQLRATSAPDVDTAFMIILLEVNLLMRQGDYSKAMETLEKHSIRYYDEDADVLHRIRLMTVKSRLYDKVGLPQKGFSVAIRAASLAHKARLLPALWEAIGALCRVLISLREFEAAAKLLESIMPQVLECEDSELVAISYALLADTHIAMAGKTKAESVKRKEEITKVLENLGRAFNVFSRLSDVEGQCEMMAKRATVMQLSGDLVLANDYAAKFLDIRRLAEDEVSW